MSARENVRCLFERRRPERVPLMESFWDDTLRKWVAQGYPTERVKRTVKERALVNGRLMERGVEREVDAPVDPVRHFNLDFAETAGWFDMMPLKGYSEVVEETEEWQVTRNGAGASFKFWKNKSGTPEHVDFRMSSREIWDRDYRPHLLAVDRERLGVEKLKALHAERRAEGRWAHFGHLFIFESLRRCLGDVGMYENVLLDPDWIHDFNRVYTDFYKAHYKVLLDEVGIPDGVWMYEDLGYNKGLLVSPKVLREMIFPYYREVVEFFHSYGLPVCLHSCGSEREALPMIVEAGFDALNPMEKAAGNDIFEYVEKYGDKLAFVGGFDKRIIESHDKALIRREVQNFMRGMKARGARFVMASDHSISTNTDYADYLYFLDVYREEMAY